MLSDDKPLECGCCGQKAVDGYQVYVCERCGKDVCTACTSAEEEPLACKEDTDCYREANRAKR